MAIKDLSKRCGTVAIVGRPNVGKSTLFNQLIGHHLSPVTYKPQTTRYNIKGVLTKDHYQIVFVDTPGIHKDHASPLNRILNRNAKSVLYDVDIILFMASCRAWTAQDQDIYDCIPIGEVPCLLLLNKVDLLKNKEALLPLLKSIDADHRFDVVIPISALRHNVFDHLREAIVSRLPVQPFMFTDGEASHHDREFVIAELVREQVMKHCHDELPYCTHIQMVSITEKDDIVVATANIWVEKAGQRTILIGAKGANLKQIGSAARKRIERLLNKQVYLQLQVKLRKSNADQHVLINNYLS